MRSKYRRGVDMVDKPNRYINLGLLLLTVVAIVLVPQVSTAALDGASIYANKCQTCHGALATHNMIPDGITSDEITTAFSSGGMADKGVTLATGEAQAIADAITPPTEPTAPTIPTTPTTPDGAALYADNCESCHGPLATSERLGQTATQIQDAINNNAGGEMGYLSTLTQEQIQAIADALAVNTASLSIKAPDDIILVATGTLTNIVDLGTPTIIGGTPPYTTINDSPIGGNFAVGETIVTWNVTDSVGATAIDTQKVTITVGSGPTTGGKISGKVFDDLNKDKDLEDNELGIADMPVKLTGTGESTKGIHMRTKTDADGNYQFLNLPPGRYCVHSKFKHGWVSTTRVTNVVLGLQDGKTVTANFGKISSENIDQEDKEDQEDKD